MPLLNQTITDQSGIVLNVLGYPYCFIVQMVIFPKNSLFIWNKEILIPKNTCELKSRKIIFPWYFMYHLWCKLTMNNYVTIMYKWRNILSDSGYCSLVLISRSSKLIQLLDTKDQNYMIFIHSIFVYLCLFSKFLLLLYTERHLFLTHLSSCCRRFCYCCHRL